MCAECFCFCFFFLSSQNTHFTKDFGEHLAAMEGEGEEGDGGNDDGDNDGDGNDHENNSSSRRRKPSIPVLSLPTAASDWQDPDGSEICPLCELPISKAIYAGHVKHCTRKTGLDIEGEWVVVFVHLFSLPSLPPNSLPISHQHQWRA